MEITFENKPSGKKPAKKTRSKFYKTLSPYMASAIAEGFCEGEGATEDQQKDAWQYLHDTGLAYRLQGWYGRTATQLIENGVITR